MADRTSRCRKRVCLIRRDLHQDGMNGQRVQSMPEAQVIDRVDDIRRGGRGRKRRCRRRLLQWGQIHPESDRRR
jgi:hypothetical protein